MKSKTSNWQWLNWLFWGRVFTASAFFMYVGSMPYLIKIWELNATQAGTIQTGLVIGFALSLFFSSYYSDFVNPNKILIISSVGNVISAFLFTYFSEGFFSALFLNASLGFFLGGIYGPSMILVSEKFSKGHKGFAMGAMLGGQSFGYALSLSISFIFSNFYNLKDGFLICSSLTLLGLLFFYICCKDDLKNRIKFKIVKKFNITSQSNQNKFLIKGYTAHTIELFGMWAWTPVFLGFVLISKTDLNPVLLGAVIALALHLTGIFSNMISGSLADRHGAKLILITFALISSSFSFLIGWISSWNWIIILLITFAYSFFTIGDSGVLTSALTDNTNRNILGRSLAFRSIIGIGFGSLAPGFFGFILDITNNHQPISASTNWIYAFSTLGIAGLFASYYATKLDRKALLKSF
ncbi:MAG: MFS transporter [Pelagibacteraceae bacterium]